jgi:hypothetical protein
VEIRANNPFSGKNPQLPEEKEPTHPICEKISGDHAT